MWQDGDLNHHFQVHFPFFNLPQYLVPAYTMSPVFCVQILFKKHCDLLDVIPIFVYTQHIIRERILIALYPKHRQMSACVGPEFPLNLKFTLSEDFQSLGFPSIEPGVGLRGNRNPTILFYPLA